MQRSLWCNSRQISAHGPIRPGFKPQFYHDTSPWKLSILLGLRQDHTHEKSHYTCNCLSGQAYTVQGIIQLLQIISCELTPWFSSIQGDFSHKWCPILVGEWPCWGLNPSLVHARQVCYHWAISLFLFREIFDCDNFGVVMLLTSGGLEPGVLVTMPHCTGQPPVNGGYTSG